MSGPKLHPKRCEVCGSTIAESDLMMVEAGYGPQDTCCNNEECPLSYVSWTLEEWNAYRPPRIAALEEEVRSLRKYEEELNQISLQLQKVHPIGQVKHVGLMECCFVLGEELGRIERFSRENARLAGENQRLTVVRNNLLIEIEQWKNAALALFAPEETPHLSPALLEHTIGQLMERLHESDPEELVNEGGQ
jgi:hypothetical protein